MYGTRPAWQDVDLGALVRNFERLRERVRPAGILAVVKSDAYGHGSVRVAQTLADAGADWLGVAFAEEGFALRRAGVGAPILVLGTAHPDEVPLYVEYRLTPNVSSLDQLRMWIAETGGQLDEPIDFHLKVDTGMSRLGLAPDELPEALELVRGHGGLRLTGLVSHFADADVPDSPRTAEQLALYESLLEAFGEGERDRLLLHVANSGGALYHPRSRKSLVRLGIALYGVDPLRAASDLEPVMSVRCRVIQLRSLAPGARAGYGGTWVAERPSRLAVLPVGYGDGYPWRLSNRAAVLIGGRRRSVVGRVSMDMLLVDVTDAPVEVGDEAVILGAQGDEKIGAWDLADWAGTIPWEVLCRFGLRMHRRYLPETED